jgi:uncharacterized protein YdeI (YjbR/CyaY-like superfamily)
METMKGLPVIFFADDGEWEAWLSVNYGLDSGIWVKMAKKRSGIKSIAYKEALDVALCYGWIDGQSKSIDETYYIQKFVPRRKKSLWSKINIGKAERLIAAGRMKEAGFTVIEAAKADGRWDAAYESTKSAVVPLDLATFLEGKPVVKAFFESLNSANRYAVLFRLMTAKTPATREARFAKITAMLEEGKTFH